MKDFRTLKLLDPFEKAFTAFGIDYPVMRRLLQLKLTMDGRRVPTIFSQNAKKKEKENANQYIKSLWIYVLFGLFMIPFLLIGDNYLFQMSFIYAIFTFFVMTSMISDFSSVLLDIRDRNILYPKPIDRKTIATAKLIHVVIYLSFLSIALIGIPMFVGLFVHGVFFFLLAIIHFILINLLIIVFTALIYLFILRFFDGEKLKDIINYVQIGLSLAIMVGYQLLVRSFEMIDVTISLNPQWWHGFLFPMWYGANMEMVLNGDYQALHISFSALALIVPLLSIGLYMKLNPMFEQSLQKLAYHGKGREKKQRKLGVYFLHLLCRSHEERAFFRFASSMMKNERDFKLKVYPSLGFSIVIPFVFIMNGFDIGLTDLATSKSYLTIYFSLLFIPTIMILLKFSGKYKGAWVYKVSPIQHLKPMFSGTIKAFLFNLYLPVYSLLSIVFILLFGIRVLPDLIVVFINACLYAVICFMILKKTLPFSESFDHYNQNSNSATIFGLMLFAGLFALLHFLSTFIWFGIYLYLALTILCLVILWKVAFNITWEKIG